MKVFLIILVVALVAGGLYFFTSSQSQLPAEDEIVNEIATDDKMMVEDKMMADQDKMMEESDSLEGQRFYETTLSDVTEGVAINGFATNGSASGNVAVAINENEENVYFLSATFTDIPELTPDFFYEGWVVRRGENQSVISTGPANLNEDGVFVNEFTSDVNLEDHDYYVLTLEPNDDDPAPADHVLDGVLTLIEL